MIDVRAKGHDFERSVATKLNAIVNGCLREGGYAAPTKPVIQRNQNQSAVGGDDLTGTFGLAIECKAVEALSPDAWWRQATASAKKGHKTAIVIYKQNRSPWQVMMECDIPYPHTPERTMRVRVTLPYTAFEVWFEDWVNHCLKKGWVEKYV